MTPEQAVTVTRGRSRARQLLARSLLLRVILANAVVATALTIAVVIVAQRLERRHQLLVILLAVAIAVLLVAIVNVVALRAGTRLLRSLNRAMETVHKGELDCRVPESSLDPQLRRLATTFNQMCERLETESLHYAAKQVSSIEEERRRIGRELHDETNQTLAATLIRLDLADKALQDRDSREAHKQVVSAVELIKHSMDEIKLLVYDLRPVMLDDFGLVPTLRWYIQSHLQGAGPAIITDFDGADLRLSGDVETALYRITQEALANAVRHADATKVMVRLETKPGFVSLAIIDNGRGFDPEALLREGGRRGLGLLSVKERVELIGGTLNIESSIGRGARLYVVVPLADPEKVAEQ